MLAVDPNISYPPSDRPVVEDAIKRLIIKEGSDKAMAERSVIVFRFKNMRCVLLKNDSRSIGGSPVYCYDIDKVVLLDHYDDDE